MAAFTLEEALAATGGTCVSCPLPLSRETRQRSIEALDPRRAGACPPPSPFDGSTTLQLENGLPLPNPLPPGEGAPTFTSVSTDTRTLEPGALFVALKGERFDAHDLLEQAASKGAAGAIVRPGTEAPLSLCMIEVEDTLVALGALARAHRRKFAIPLGAVGGSNGKTTTKEMVGQILAARGPSLRTDGNLNNEVGVPLTLLRLSSAHLAAVVEMGMNHPGELDRLSRIAEPTCALLTSVGAEHLEGLGSLEAVADAEGEIFRGLSADGLAIVNADDPLALEQGKRSGRPLRTFGTGEGVDVRLAAILSHDADGLRVAIDANGQRHEVRLAYVGTHNALNACGAFAMGLALGCPPETCVRGLEAARPFHHRLELHRTRAGVTILDDCYNANPSSMAAALGTLEALSSGRRRVAILGDMLELGSFEVEEHRKLGILAGRSGLSALVAFGPRSKETFDSARAAIEDATHIADPEAVGEAVAFLSRTLAPGDWLLVKGSRGMRLERVVAALNGRVGGGH